MVFDDRLYVIGGQEGDFMAKPGSPIFKCSRRSEVSNKTGKIDYVLELIMWKELLKKTRLNFYIIYR